MEKREKAVWIILCMVLAMSIIMPVKGLLLDGVYEWHIKQKEFAWMMAEIAAVATVLGIVWLVVPCSVKGARRLILTGIVCMVFAWLHVALFPMILSALYVGYLFLTGQTIRTRILGDGGQRIRLADFLLGSGGVITVFCLLSALGAGSISILKCTVLLTGMLQLIQALGVWSKKRHTGGDFHWTKFQSILLVFMIVMVLIQIGRMGISLDFDSLWYGVRSEYMLDNGGGIYENPGTVGLVYTYSKGLEVLLLPLSDLPSHSYLIFFNIWMAVLTLACVYRIGRCYMNRTYSLLAVACVSGIPAVMNMSITAKADSMTLFIQMMMVLYLLYYVKRGQTRDLFISTSAFLLSLTLKPTAVVFSTAVFGMSLLYLFATNRFSVKGPWKQWMIPFLSLTALIGIWARTVMIAGIPVTSVFSSIFARMGFRLNYPFADLPLYGGEGGGALVPYLLDTVYRMLLYPVGETMNHVVIAWGTSLLFFLIAVCLLAVVAKKRPMETEPGLIAYAYTVLIPFVLVCMVSLLMLGQIDGNYFMLLDVFLILLGCAVISRLQAKALRTSTLVMMIPILLLNVTVTAVSNWAWSLWFSPIEVMNKGYIDHEAEQQKAMEESGNARIWGILAENPKIRVIAAGNHPQVFAFPCNVQSYDDITSSWGNVVLVKTMDNFTQYLNYAKTDYIYMQAGTIERDSRCHELMGYLIEAGVLTDMVYEEGNMLAKVDLQGEYSLEATMEYETYFENYRVK